MVNNICSIYREKKRSEKKSGKGSNNHMTVGNGEMENITVVKGGGGCSTNGHMTVGNDGGGGGGGGGGGCCWRGREKVGSWEGEGEGEMRGERGGVRAREGKGADLSCLGPWAKPWAFKFS